MTPREILEEFASFRQGVDTYEVFVFLRKDFRGEHFRDFDIEDPRAMAAEVRRLERLRPGPLPEPKAPVHVVRRAKRRPCEVCGGPTPENALGPVARFCSDTCRFTAHHRERLASKKCRLVSCGHDAAEGKTYCRSHLDVIAARERARRRQQSETRKAA